MNYAALDERELVRRAQERDSEAFQQLYREHVGTVFGFLRRRVGAQAAEDLTAETFARAYEHLPRFEWRGVPFRAWLLRIAYNLVVGRSRSRSSTDVVMAEPPDAGVRSTEEEVVQSLEGAEVLATLRTLSDAHQTVLDLRYLRELSVPATAEVLDISEEAVRALTYRALKALREAHVSS